MKSQTLHHLMLFVMVLVAMVLFAFSTPSYAQASRTPHFDVPAPPVDGSCFLYSATTGFWESSDPMLCGGGGGGGVDPTQFVSWVPGLGFNCTAVCGGDAPGWAIYPDGGSGEYTLHFASTDATLAPGTGIDFMQVNRSGNPGECDQTTPFDFVACSIQLSTSGPVLVMQGDFLQMQFNLNDDGLVDVYGTQNAKYFTWQRLSTAMLNNLTLSQVSTSATGRATATNKPPCEIAQTITPPYECVQADDKLVVAIGQLSTATKYTVTTDGIVMNSAVILKTLTVSTLPTCTAGLSGAMYAVSDATAPTYNGTLTGSGTVHVPVFCNGTAWTSH